MSKRINAFPATGEYSYQQGMALRDYFASKMLPAMYRDYWDDVRAGRECPADGDWRMALAIDAYSIADSMLKAKEYNNENPQQN